MSGLTKALGEARKRAVDRSAAGLEDVADVLLTEARAFADDPTLPEPTRSKAKDAVKKLEEAATAIGTIRQSLAPPKKPNGGAAPDPELLARLGIDEADEGNETDEAVEVAATEGAP